MPAIKRVVRSSTDDRDFIEQLGFYDNLYFRDQLETRRMPMRFDFGPILKRLENAIEKLNISSAICVSFCVHLFLVMQTK